MGRWLSHVCCAALVLVCLFAPAGASAQTASFASIGGLVLDSQGLPVPDVTVTATNTATGLKYSTKTTSTGNYNIPDLPPGTYDIKVQPASASLGTAEAKGIKLNVGEARDLNFSLRPAGTVTTVEVTAEVLLEKTKSDVSATVTDLDMERLPTIAGGAGTVNDYAQLALTAPGMKIDTSGVSSPNGQANSGDLIGPGSINFRGNLYLVDGGNITDQLVSGRDGTGASVDEVQEFQVITNNYNAEYGQASGVILSVVTKSGSNQVHGDGHMYFRGRNLGSSDPFYNAGFIDPSTGVITDPRCPNVGTTDISGCPRAPFHRKEGGFTIGGPFIKDKLFWFGSYEDSRQSVPLTLTPFGNPTTVQSPVNNLLYSGKIDYKISDKNTLTMRYAVDRLRESNIIVQTGTNVTPDDLAASLINNASVNVGWVSSISNNLVNEARFVFTRFVTSTADNSSVPGVIHADGTTTGADFCCPQGGLQKRYQYIDNLTWTHGNHTFKAGFNVSYYPWNSLFPQFHFGQYTFNDATNTPTSLTVAFGAGEVTSKDNIYGAYFQDTWKITRKLTMNIGLRYDFEAGAFKGGKIPGAGGGCLQGNGLILACSSDPNNFQPRLGFAYAPWGDKTVFRASFAEVTMLAYNNVVLDSLNFDGTTLNTVTIDPTQPCCGLTGPQIQALLNTAFPNLPSASALAPFAPQLTGPFGRVRPIANNLRNPEMRMFTMGVEHEFTKTLKAGAQYIGQFGFGLFGEQDLNAPALIADPAHPGFFYFGARPNANFAAVRTNENSRTSHYNGLLLSVQKNFSNHVQFLASYTWSHATDSGEDFFGLSEPGNPFNCCRAEMGPAFNDIRHAANMGVVLDSGHVTANRYGGFFINNLGLSWLGQIQSGRPYPISTGSAPFGGSERFFGAGNETQQRPNVLPGGIISSAGIASFDGINALFGPGAVAQCILAGFPAGQCNAIQNTFLAPVVNSGAIDALTGQAVDFQLVNGNVERDAGRGSPFVRFDASLHKTYSIPHAENVKLELRFDALNVFNHPNWVSFLSNDVLAVMGISATNIGGGLGAGGALPNANFFTCTGCMRPDGTFVGTNGQALTLKALQQGGAINSSAFNGLGNPGADDNPRRLQLSFHVRW